MLANVSKLKKGISKNQNVCLPLRLIYNPTIHYAVSKHKQHFKQLGL
jgi:hypothetical protein